MRARCGSTGGCASWYLDANGRNTTLWPDFTWRFRQRTRRFDPAHYVLRAPRPGASPSPPDRARGARRNVSFLLH